MAQQVPSGQTLTWLMLNEIARSHHLCFEESRVGDIRCQLPHSSEKGMQEDGGRVRFARSQSHGAGALLVPISSRQDQWSDC